MRTLAIEYNLFAHLCSATFHFAINSKRRRRRPSQVLFVILFYIIARVRTLSRGLALACVSPCLCWHFTVSVCVRRRRRR